MGLAVLTQVKYNQRRLSAHRQYCCVCPTKCWCVCESKYELLIFIRSGNNILYCTLMTMTTMCPVDVNIDKIRFVRGQIIVRTSYIEVIRSKMFRIHSAT